MAKVLLGKKIGMTQVFDQATGKVTPVTVVDVSNNHVAKVLNSGDKITHIELGKDKQKKSMKPDLGNYKSLNFVPRFKRAFKMEAEDQVTEVGTELKADLFQVGDIVDIVSTTKGKGFQGVMKRWGFKGGKATHGQSDRDRAPGSIGSGTTVGRVFKGLKMAGHQGNVRKTIKRLKVVDVDVENSLLSISGSIPGHKGTYLVVKESFYNKLKK